MLISLHTGASGASIYLNNDGSGLNIKFQMVLINFWDRLHIPHDFYIVLTASRWLNRLLDLHFGPKDDENQYFCVK